MHPFHEYLTGQLAEKLAERRVVCFYDPRGEFTPFVDELQVIDDAETPLPRVILGELAAHLARYQGSFFGLRATVEPLVAIDQPAPLLLYLPGVERDRSGSVLMELEKGGICYEPQLKRLARNVLRRSFTDGRIDEMLESDGIGYHDVVGFVEQAGAGGGASMLKVIFGTQPDVHLVAQWVMDDSTDDAVQGKGAAPELMALVRHRLGLDLDDDMALDEARDRTLRFALVNEFRADLAGEPPMALSMVPGPSNNDQLARVKELARRLRDEYPQGYVEQADRIEQEMGLAELPVSASDLGVIDTFRFEEVALLAHSGELITQQQYEQAAEVVTARGRSFWVDRDVGRQAQWEAMRRLAELGRRVEEVRPRLRGLGSNPAAWVDAYAGDDGWHRLDQAHRSAESWFAQMDDEPEAAQALAVVRQQAEELLREMADGFTAAMVSAGWSVPGALHQTRVFPEVVEGRSGRTALFLVDALRYEMGVELARHLGDAKEAAIRPAVAALPTITPIGMAALLPGASASFSAVAHKNRLVAAIEDQPLPGVAERMKFLRANQPDAVEMTLGKLFQLSVKKLSDAVGSAPLVVVRSQEIDALGELGDDWLARQLMDGVIGNIARAVRKLSRVGVEQFVITADHGHQFSQRKGEDMRTDNPGGDTVELHRRCWAGHGGTTPPGTVRVSGAELGYASDLDFVFPTGLGVFRAQGGLSFHHGGVSLQELIIPVLTFRMPAPVVEERPGIQVTLSKVDEAVTNRMFTVGVHVQGDLFHRDAVLVRPVLVSDGEQVGRAGMAVPGEFDPVTGCVAVVPGTEVSVGMMLNRDDVKSLRIVMQDPTTDAVLASSDELAVKLGI